MKFSAIDAITNNLVAARFWMFLAILFAGLAVSSPYFTVLAMRAKEKVVRFPRFCGLGCDKGEDSHEQE
jgi:hypothetical protein